MQVANELAEPTFAHFATIADGPVPGFHIFPDFAA
jgi:hypothetical protein